jgi:hypothetical protein
VLIAWAVVKDDNLHRRPKRAPVTLPLPADLGFILFLEILFHQMIEYRGQCRFLTIYPEPFSRRGTPFTKEAG